MTLANSRLRTIGEYAVAVVLCLVIVTFVMRLWRANPRTPFEYGGDALFHGMVIKGIIDNGWYLRNNFIGMPGGAELFCFPMADNLHFLLIKIFSLFSSDYALIFNFYFLLTFPLTTISSLYVFRHFNISYLIAVLGSLLYTFLPYHFFRNQHHLVLAGYYIVPLMVMVLLWVFSGRLLRSGSEDNNAARKINLRSKRFIASVIICLLIASGGLGYYAFFACFFLAVAGVAAALYWKSFRHLMVALILIAVVFSGFVINLVPNMIYLRSDKENRTVKRRIGEAEDYGLKVTQLLLPIEGHRIKGLARLKAKYNSNAPLVNENTTASLGLIGGIGFLSLLAWLFYRMSARTKEATGARALLNQLSILNFSGVLLATIGGFASLFALLISSQIRSYNRISIYLAFFSLFAVMLLLESFSRRRVQSRKPRLIFQLSLGLLLVLGILDQTGKGDYFVPDYAAVATENASDADFVSRIEMDLPDGGMIFQLPYVPFPEASVPGLEGYEHFRPYLHSKKLRWSYGTIKERENDRWQKLITNMPTDQFLETISLAGFSGVYIDRRGYTDSGAEMESRLANLLDTMPLVSADGQMVFLNMGGYNRKLAEKYGAEIGTKRDIALHPLTVEWTGGCSGLEGSAENNWHWCSSQGELVINNPSLEERKLKLEMAFGSGYQEFANLSLDGSLISERLKINNKPTAYSTEISVPPGQHTIRFTCDAKPIHAPLDKRSLVFQVQNFNLQELK